MPHTSSGVYHDNSKFSKPWRVKVKNKHIGYFATDKEAHRAYEKAVMEINGEGSQSQEVSNGDRKAVHCDDLVSASLVNGK